MVLSITICGIVLDTHVTCETILYSLTIVVPFAETTGVSGTTYTVRVYCEDVPVSVYPKGDRMTCSAHND
jgi:hypothetical protein